MKLWIASEHFYPEEVSTGYLLTQIANEISFKAEVNVICGPIDKKSVFSNSDYTINDNIKIHRVSIPYLNKKRIFCRFIQMFLLTLSIGLKIAKKIKKRDSLIIVTNPPTLLIFISLLRIVKSFRYSIIVHDVYPENLLPAGMMKSTSFIYRFLLLIFNFAYKKADKLIVLGSDMGKLMAAKTDNKIIVEVIPNWSDSLDIYPLNNFSSTEYYQLDFSGKVVIQFAGNIGRVQGLKEFFTLFKKAANPQLVLIIIGEGALKNELQLMQVKQNLRNIYFYPPKARAEQLNFLNACDIGLIVLSPGMYGLGVPSKIYNILAAEKPILFLGDSGAEPASYIADYDIGWSFNWEEQESCINFLQSISIDDLERIKQKGLNARKLAEMKFTKNIILSKYEVALTQ